jgi:hypothetical protein
MMTRRWVALGVGLVLVIVIVLVVNGCLKSQKQQSLKEYNHQAGALAQEMETQVARPLFSTLTNAGSKSALDVEVQVDQLRSQAQSLASAARKLSVPGEMTEAQRNLLLTSDLRVEGLSKLVSVLPKMLGGQAKQTAPLVAGDMQIFLTSDTIYSQRVIPLTQEALQAGGVGQVATAASRFLPNTGWLDPETVVQRITGQGSGSSSQGVSPGTHGSALVGVSVGTNQLAPEPTINHVSGGGNPTFTVIVENTGSNPESNVKVDVTVTAAGKQYKASHVINQTQPESKVNVEIPVTGIPVGVAAKIEVAVEPVPGEEDTENNKATYLAIFSQ